MLQESIIKRCASDVFGKVTRQFGNNIIAASRQVVAPGALIGQLPSRKSRYFPNTSDNATFNTSSLSFIMHSCLFLPSSSRLVLSSLNSGLSVGGGG